MFGKLDASSPDVPAEVALGIRGVMPLYRIEQQAVLGVDHPHPTWSVTRHEGPAVVLSGVPQSGNHRCQLVEVTTAVGQQMELAVQLKEATDVRVGFDCVLDVLQSADVVSGEVRNALAQRERLEAFAP